MQRLCRLVFAVIILASLVRGAAAEVERHALLAPSVRQVWQVVRFSESLTDCRRRFGRLERISLPVMGTRTYGFLAAYFETIGRDMFLEIDRDGLIKFLTFPGAE